MAVLAPGLALLLGVAGALLVGQRGGSRTHVGQLLLSGLEALLPLAVAAVAVSVLARDTCRELHLSLPASYAGTLGRRIAVLAGSAALLATGYSVVVWLTGWWTGPGVAGAALVWLAPVLWLTGVAVLVAMVSRSVVLGSGVASVLWLAEQMFAYQFRGHGWTRPFHLFATTRWPGTDGWLANRVVLAGSGALIVLLVAALLRRPDRLLTEEEV